LFLQISITKSVWISINKNITKSDHKSFPFVDFPHRDIQFASHSFHHMITTQNISSMMT
jgi:hypothetical protein